MTPFMRSAQEIERKRIQWQAFDSFGPQMCDFAKADVKASPHLLFCFWLASIEINENVKISLLWVLEQSHRKKTLTEQDYRPQNCFGMQIYTLAGISRNYPSIIIVVCSQMYGPASSHSVVNKLECLKSIFIVHVAL